MMADHGASAIITVNILLAFTCVALAVFTLPWWMALSVATLMLALRNFALDQYGGMQFCLLLLPGVLAGVLVTGQFLQNAEESGKDVEWLAALVSMVVPIVILPVAFFVMMAVPVAAVLAYERIRDHIKKPKVK